MSSAVPGEICVAPVDTKGEPCEDVGCDWEGDEERLKGEGLVVGTCEKEIGFGG